jgi:hypothetical protein
MEEGLRAKETEKEINPSEKNIDSTTSNRKRENLCFSSIWCIFVKS